LKLVWFCKLCRNRAGVPHSIMRFLLIVVELVFIIPKFVLIYTLQQCRSVVGIKFRFSFY
jgi:hypothetical protein